MLLIFILVTFFNACVFYYFSKHANSKEDIERKPLGNTFVKYYEMDGDENLSYLLTICYYISTTTNIIGYGDMTPKSNIEKLWHIPLMFQG